jgi:hypothetical protein
MIELPLFLLRLTDNSFFGICNGTYSESLSFHYCGGGHQERRRAYRPFSSGGNPGSPAVGYPPRKEHEVGCTEKSLFN